MITRNGYLVDFDTTKRTKYSDDIIKRVLDLRRWSLSLRDISGNTGIPLSSVRNILLREKKLYVDFTNLNTLTWLTREQCRLYYDLSDKQFDYVFQAYPELTKKVNYTRFINRSYITNYMYDKKAYKKTK